MLLAIMLEVWLEMSVAISLQIFLGVSGKIAGNHWKLAG